jgi:hypothetical protein
VAGHVAADEVEDLVVQQAAELSVLRLEAQAQPGTRENRSVRSRRSLSIADAYKRP